MKVATSDPRKLIKFHWKITDENRNMIRSTFLFNYFFQFIFFNLFFSIYFFIDSWYNTVI